MADAAQALIVPAGRLTTKQVMDRLGKKQRTVQDLAKQGLLRWQEMPRPHTKPERLYFEEDVEKLAAAADQRKLNAAGATGGDAALAKQAGMPDALQQLASALAYQADTAREQREEERVRVPIHLKLWLTLREAHEYSGLGIADLKRLCEDGKLTSRVSGRRQLLIMRASLDGFQG